MTIYYTSDLHLNHANLAKHRKFDTIEAMNKAITESLLSILTSDDILYHLGDFCMYNVANREKVKELLQCLPCPVVAIKGNHDPVKFLESLKAQKLVQNWHNHKTVLDRVSDADVTIQVFHHPVIDYHTVQNPICCLHGHCHGTLRFPHIDTFDVGWDIWKRPVTLQEVLQAYFPSEPDMLLDKYLQIKSSAYSTGEVLVRGRYSQVKA